jgi:hypothetical protein
MGCCFRGGFKLTNRNGWIGLDVEFRGLFG